MSPQQKRKRLVYLFMVFVIGLISVYDNVLNIIFSNSLPDMESNPAASWLITYGGVILLVELKALSSIIAVVVCMKLIYTKYRYVIIPVFLFQLWLFYYLTFQNAHPEVYGFLEDFRLWAEEDNPLKKFWKFYTD